MGAEAHTELSAGRSTQERLVDDLLVVEEYARLWYGFEDHEEVTAEAMLFAWTELHGLWNSGALSRI